MACFLKHEQAVRLIKNKSNVDGELKCLALNDATIKMLKERVKELEKVNDVAAGVCLIDVEMELELERSDMVDALHIKDPNKLVETFPALNKIVCLKLVETLRNNQAEIERQFIGGKPALVPLSFRGYGVHCGEGWIVADERLIGSLTQIINATVTFVVGEGNDKKVLKFEPTERISFAVRVKEAAKKTCCAVHPAMAFMKLGKQTAGEDNPDYPATEWELEEQKLLDDNKLPIFKLPLFNDLDITKKFSIVQVGPGKDGKVDRSICLIDPNHVESKMENRPGVFFMTMKVNQLDKYLACEPQGGVAYSQDGELFTLCGFVYAARDGLTVEGGEPVPREELLPLHGDTLSIFTHAKNFMYNRLGQAMSEGQSIAYNYQMMAEFAKDLLIKSLASTFEIKFLFPTYDNEKFSMGQALDVTGYFAKELAKNGS